MFAPMKTIRRCDSIEQATMLKTLLEGNGIDAFIPDEVSAGLATFLFNTGQSGVRVQVADEDADAAEEVLRASSE